IGTNGVSCSSRTPSSRRRSTGSEGRPWLHDAPPSRLRPHTRPFVAGYPLYVKSGMTRRDLLALLGAAAVFPGARRPGEPRTASEKPAPFSLHEVRLLEGPFLQAQKRDLAYMVSLQPDRLLHNFRVNAGLEPKAPVYGGWESQEPWIDIRCHGHTLGHY